MATVAIAMATAMAAMIPMAIPTTVPVDGPFVAREMLVTLSVGTTTVIEPTMLSMNQQLTEPTWSTAKTIRGQSTNFNCVVHGRISISKCGTVLIP